MAGIGGIFGLQLAGRTARAFARGQLPRAGAMASRWFRGMGRSPWSQGWTQAARIGGLGVAGYGAYRMGRRHPYLAAAAGVGVGIYGRGGLGALYNLAGPRIMRGVGALRAGGAAARSAARGRALGDEVMGR